MGGACECLSVFGESGKITLHLPVPPHSCYGISPPTFHALQGAFVRVITSCDHFLQVAILRFYHRISRISMEWEVTWSTHLFTCHCFHKSHIPSSKTSLPKPQYPGRSGLRDADDVARGVAERAVAHSPGLRRRLLEHLGPRRLDLLEGGVEVVGAEYRSLQRALGHE